MQIPVNLNFDSLKSKLARSLKDTLTREATHPEGERPIECEVHVPYHHLRPSVDEVDVAHAEVTYIVNCPAEKKHRVRIKFNYDKFGRFLRNTLQYV